MNFYLLNQINMKIFYSNLTLMKILEYAYTKLHLKDSLFLL